MSDNIISSSRTIARTVMSWPLDLNALAKQVDRSAVSHALDGYRKAMIPMGKLTKAERQDDQQALARLIRSIGLRIRPDFTEDQAQMWITAMVEALDDQPARIAMLAAKEAQRHPLQFPGEVLKIILEKAEPHRIAYSRAIRNLESLLKSIDNPPLIEATTEAKDLASQISNAEIQDMPSQMRQLGLAAGFLIEETDASIRWATADEQAAHEQRAKERRKRALSPRTSGGKHESA